MSELFALLGDYRENVMHYPFSGDGGRKVGIEEAIDHILFDYVAYAFMLKETYSETVISRLLSESSNTFISLETIRDMAKQSLTLKWGDRVIRDVQNRHLYWIRAMYDVVERRAIYIVHPKTQKITYRSGYPNPLHIPLPTDEDFRNDDDLI